MENIYNEVDNLFIENYMYNNYEIIYSNEINDEAIEIENFSEIYKNITIMNKSFENNNSLFIKNQPEKKKKEKKGVSFYMNNFNIIKSIFKNKKKSILKKTITNNKNKYQNININNDNNKNNNSNYNNNNTNIEYKKLIINKNNKKYLNIKKIIEFINNFQNLNPLLSLQNKKFFENFLEDIKKSITKTTIDVNYLNKNDINNLNLSKKLKNKIKKLEKDREFLKIQNKNLILINQKNFILFKNKILENEDLDGISFKLINIKKKIDNCDYKGNIEKNFKYDFKIDENNFKKNLNNLEKINSKKVKILTNIINEKIRLLINHYKIIIFNKKNVSFYKHSIIHYIYEIIYYQKVFNFKLLDQYFNKIESKFIFLKTKINLIFKKQKENYNDDNLSFKSIDSIINEKKYKIINEPIFPKVNRINKSFEIKTKTKTVKYFNNKFIKNINKNDYNKKFNNLNFKLMKNSNMDYILNLKEPNYKDNIYDIIEMENNLDKNFFKIHLDEYLLKLENVKVVKKEMVNNLKFNLFYKIIKFFGIKKSKIMIENVYPYLLFDYKFYIKSQFKIK